MGIFQILLLHSLILYIFAGILEDSNSLLEYAKKTTEECYCVPIKKSEMRVSEILNSELQQDERLVVYFYKNNHNEVTIYIPNSVKQKVLPEFTLDNNDILKKNTTVNTNNLFYIDKSDVMLHESNSRPTNIILLNQPYLITDYTQFLQIPQYFQNIPNCYDNTLPGPIHPDLNIQNESTCCGNIITLLQSIFEKHSHLPINTKEITRNKLEPNENKEPSNVDTLHPQDVWNYIIPSEENIPLYYPDGIHDVWDLIIAQLNEDKPSNSDNVLPQDVLDLIIAELNKEKHTHIFNQSKTSGVKGHNGPSQINDHYIMTVLTQPQMTHITFDQWFSLQVNLLKKDKYVMSYAINIEMLKILLQNTLYKNGISITDAGDLIDFNGEKLSIDSLELRPVLIGDPIKYEEFLSSHDCVLASEFPYIEAILVTLSKPRRFLGLISLREASVFDTRRSGSLICPPSYNGNSFSSVPIVPESLVENSNDLWNWRSSPNDLPDYPDKLWRSEKINVKQIDNDFEDISSPKGLGSEDNDYSDVGLRIIGGQAATSSGTPVSSKGKRSVKI